MSDLQVAPGLPHTIAVAQYGDAGSRAVAVYDDGVAPRDLRRHHRLEPGNHRQNSG